MRVELQKASGSAGIAYQRGHLPLDAGLGDRAEQGFGDLGLGRDGGGREEKNGEDHGERIAPRGPGCTPRIAA